MGIHVFIENGRRVERPFTEAEEREWAALVAQGEAKHKALRPYRKQIKKIQELMAEGKDVSGLWAGIDAWRAANPNVRTGEEAMEKALREAASWV